MVHYVFTPWRDRRELLAVRRQFYPDGTAASALAHGPDAAAAVARVAVWMQRGQCPHMVESTALLAAVVLGEGGGQAPVATSCDAAATAYTTRAAYAAAFSRFVTGLLDGHQDRARKLSMHGLARAVGLPPAFVELRHQATHEPLPSLRRLRAGARQALGWIWQYYWGGLDGGGDDDEKEEGENKDDDVQTSVLSCVDGDGDIASVVQRYGDKAVLAALAALADGATPARTLRCMRLSREVLEGRGEREREEKETTTTTTAAAETGDTPPWTAANLDLDAMRAAMAKQRQALYEVGEEVAKETEETEEQEEKDEEDDNDHDIPMADDNTDDTDNEWPAPRPRWTRYDGDWTAQPIGIVIRA